MKENVKKIVPTMMLAETMASATNDYVSPQLAGYVPAVGPVDGLTLTNAGLGGLALVLAGKEDTKPMSALGLACYGSRLITDAAYTTMKKMLPTPTVDPTLRARYQMPVRRNSRPIMRANTQPRNVVARVTPQPVKAAVSGDAGNDPYRRYTEGVIQVD